MVSRLRFAPDKILNHKCHKIHKNRLSSDEVRRLVKDLGELCLYYKGVGLAAPQIGLPLRAFATNTGWGMRVYINPDIVEMSKEDSIETEMCLSMPGVAVNIGRFKWVKFRALLPNGEYVTRTVHDFEARVFQHEYSHLQGRLIVGENYANMVVIGDEGKR